MSMVRDEEAGCDGGGFNAVRWNQGCGGGINAWLCLC